MQSTEGPEGTESMICLTFTDSRILATGVQGSVPRPQRNTHNAAAEQQQAG